MQILKIILAKAKGNIRKHMGKDYWFKNETEFKYVRMCRRIKTKSTYTDERAPSFIMYFLKFIELNTVLGTQLK